MTPPAEKGKGLLQGGVLDFEIVDLLLESGDLRSVRGVAAGRAAVAESKKPIGRTSTLYTDLYNLLKGRKIHTFDVTIHQRLSNTAMFSEARNIHIAFQRQET